MSKRNNPENLLFNPIYILTIILIIFIIYKSNASNSFKSTSLTINWNLDDLDIIKNQNPLRVLILLETKKPAAPITPSPREVLQKPTNYYGQYLQFSGSIKSFKMYTPHNNLENITIGNSIEIIMLANDGTSMIDCFLIGYDANLTVGANVTVYGYCPGLRYAQNSQGLVTAYLTLIGQTESQNSASNDVIQSPTLPATSSSISPFSPNS